MLLVSLDCPCFCFSSSCVPMLLVSLDCPCFCFSSSCVPMLLVSLDCPCFCFSSSCVPMLRVSLDCPVLIAPSVFSNVYLLRLALIPRSAYISGASRLNLGFCKTLCYSSFTSFIVFFTIIFVWLYAFFWY